MKKLILILFLAAFVPASVFPQYYVRRELNFPNINGMQTLKCDFHMHTVFSDGLVWPTVRVDEAWRDGLDAVAITDHIEYLPHKDDIPVNHDRAFEIARDRAEKMGIIAIKGSEVTRKMPPGHLNAIFLKDSKAIVKDDWKESLAEARKQGAFIFWNHPGWKAHQKDGISRWYEEHTELFVNDQLHGIEVVNTVDYYPEVQEWCEQKNLTMLGNSDQHNPIDMDFNFDRAEHRAITLVFAKDKSEEGIREALFDRRTAVYSGNELYGLERFLRPLFENSVSIRVFDPDPEGGSLVMELTNNSPLDYILESEGGNDGMSYNKSVKAPAGCTVMITVKNTANKYRRISLPYKVTNLHTGRDQSLEVSLNGKL